MKSSAKQRGHEVQQAKPTTHSQYAHGYTQRVLMHSERPFNHRSLTPSLLAQSPQTSMNPLIANQISCSAIPYQAIDLDIEADAVPGKSAVRDQSSRAAGTGADSLELPSNLQMDRSESSPDQLGEIFSNGPAPIADGIYRAPHRDLKLGSKTHSIMQPDSASRQNQANGEITLLAWLEQAQARLPFDIDESNPHQHQTVASAPATNAGYSSDLRTNPDYSATAPKPGDRLSINTMPEDNQQDMPSENSARLVKLQTGITNGERMKQQGTATSRPGVHRLSESMRQDHVPGSSVPESDQESKGLEPAYCTRVNNKLASDSTAGNVIMAIPSNRDIIKTQVNQASPEVGQPVFRQALSQHMKRLDLLQRQQQTKNSSPGSRSSAGESATYEQRQQVSAAESTPARGKQVTFINNPITMVKPGRHALLARSYLCRCGPRSFK